jgi:hypothetical protein
VIPYVIRTRQTAPGRYRAWATLAGRRVSRTYGPPPTGCRLPHAWAADQLGRAVGLAADSSPLWGAAALPTVAFQAWA